MLNEIIKKKINYIEFTKYLKEITKDGFDVLPEYLITIEGCSPAYIDYELDDTEEFYNICFTVGDDCYQYSFEIFEEDGEEYFYNYDSQWERNIEILIFPKELSL